MESNSKKLKAVVIGATGATGRDLVDHLIESDIWGSVFIVVRRKISRWEDSSRLKGKLVIYETKDSLDLLNESKEDLESRHEEFKNLSTYSTVFCCLGSKTGNGEKVFRQVDQTYVLYSATLCNKFNIPHFSLITSVSSDSKSSFLYLRVKGEVENELKTLKIQKLSIFRPGFIKNRDNDFRCVECLFKFLCCCCTSVHSRQLTRAIQNEAEDISTKDSSVNIYENKDIIELAKKR